LDGVAGGEGSLGGLGVLDFAWWMVSCDTNADRLEACRVLDIRTEEPSPCHPEAAAKELQVVF